MSATVPRPGSSFISLPTYCRPRSRRSSPWVPGHNALTRVVAHLPTHLLRAAEPQEFALGPRPQHPYPGPPSSPNPPTTGRRAVGVGPRSPTTASRPGWSLISLPTYCGPPSRRSWPLGPGHNAPIRVVVHLPTHLLRAAQLQELTLSPRPQRHDQGRRAHPNPSTAGHGAAEACPWSPAATPRPGQHAQHQTQRHCTRQRPRASARQKRRPFARQRPRPSAGQRPSPSARQRPRPSARQRQGPFTRQRPSPSARQR